MRALELFGFEYQMTSMRDVSLIIAPPAERHWPWPVKTVSPPGKRGVTSAATSVHSSSLTGGAFFCCVPNKSSTRAILAAEEHVRPVCPKRAGVRKKAAPSPAAARSEAAAKPARGAAIGMG